MSAIYENVAPGVIAIDTEYVRPRMDASHLIIDEGRAAFVDTGTYFSVPNLLKALAAQDLGADSVDYILLTHVHLDHAGGVGRLAAELPRARVLVHPRGLSHIVDPSILVAASKAVYGESRFAEEYGQVTGVPAERVDGVADLQQIKLGRRTLEFIHTPGHALHHLCIVDRDTAEIFTGDTFGVSYRESDTDRGEFIFPTTSPSQFDPQQLHASIERILEYQPTAAYLTHYSRVTRVAELAADMHSDIDVFVRIAKGTANGPDRVAQIAAQLFDHLSARLAKHGFKGNLARQHELLDGDIDLNASGLAIWLARSRA